MTDAGLLAHFAAAFPKGNRPHPYRRDPAALDSLYNGLPDGFGCLPLLYEQFLLAYSWRARRSWDTNCVEFGYGYPNEINLVDNIAGETLAAHREAAAYDPGLSETLIPNGYFSFGKGWGGHFDPVCFATRERKDGDCPIVLIDHEEILCNYRIRVVTQLASSFRDLAERTCSYSKLKAKRK